MRVPRLPAARAAAYLLSQRSADGRWGSSVWLNGLIYEAVHDYQPDDPANRLAIAQWLISQQSDDGSWGQDPYATALAIRALGLTGTAPTNPTQGAMTLQITDSQSGGLLAGVAVVVQGPSSANGTTDESGRVVIAGLAPGNYGASASIAGYAQLLVNFGVLADRTTDLGRLQLSRSTTASSTTARFGGTVTASPSGSPIAGASVLVGALPPVVTDAAGRWTLANVAPGSYSITVSSAGYLSAVATVSALAGREYDFSPSLQPAAAGAGTDAQGCRLYGTLRRAADGLPVAGASVALSGANAGVGTTDSSGGYLIGALRTGTTMVAVTATGYDAVGGTAALSCDLPVAYEYSPLLYASGSTPANANTASLTFTLVNASNEQPLRDIAVRITPSGQSARTVQTAADGRFTVSGLNVASVLLEITATGFDPVAVTYQVEPLEAKDMGQLRLRPSGGEALLPDLRVVSVRRGTATANVQTLQVSGALSVDVANAGRAAISREARLTAFVDLDRDGRYDAMIDRGLGQFTLSSLLAAGQSTNIAVQVSGVLPFRDAPIHVWIDSDQVIAEINEANNIKSTADAAEIQPAIGTFKPKLKWHWQSSTVHSTFNQVMMAPVVGRVFDTNGDGRIDDKDTPSVVFTTWSGTNYMGPGVIRVIHGATGVELLTIRDTTAEVAGSANLALADLDADGKPEIVAIKVDGGLVVFRNNGTKWWTTPPLHPYPGGSSWGAPTVADLDGDGKPEVIFGRHVYSFDGVKRWTASTSFVGGPGAWTAMSMAADLNLDGTQALIVGPSAHAAGGSLLWSNSAVPDGFVAVANFNSDPYPEVVVAGAGKVSLLDRTGKLIWQVSQPGSQFGGPPTIADVDGDGVPDIGVANATRYSVFRADGSVLWSVPTQDASSYTTGSTVFDFDGDGQSEVLYADEITIKAYRGINGAVLWSVPNTSITTHEYPLVVDLDNDGHADMVTIGNDAYSIQNQTQRVHGVRAFQDENNSWVNTRSLWNQHAYSITNVNDDLTIPARPQPSWLAHNTFRANKRLDVSATAVADATASFMRLRDGGSLAPSRITVRVSNGGALATPLGMKVAFYAGAAGGTPVLGVVSMPRALQPGEFDDVSIDVPGPLSTTPIITVVADDDGTGRHAITDFDRSNNSVQGDASQLALALTIGAATDKPTYNELDTAVFTGIVDNAGSFSSSAQVRLSVETADGRLVETLALPPAVTVAAAGRAQVALQWSAAGVLTGSYRLRAELIDSAGLVYGSAVAPFSVEASYAAPVGSRIGTDRVLYTAAQDVQLRSRVFNATTNMVVDDLDAVTTVVDATGRVMWTRTEQNLELAPRASREFVYGVPASSLLPGDYVARLDVFDGQGGLRSASTARFSVLGTDYSGVGLRGTLDVPATLAVGQTGALGWSVINGGNAALADVPLVLRIVDPATGTLRAQFQLSATLDIGAAVAGASNWLASGATGDVVAVLVATIGGREYPLAQAPFKVTAPQVVIDLALDARPVSDARVLVLMSCPVGTAAGDDAACVLERSAALDALLTSLGVPHRIVSTAAEFETEMRCGAYNVYWISGGAIKLSHQVVKELREAVRRGDGLVVDGLHDSRNLLLHPVAGVKQIGKLPGSGYTAQVAQGHAFDAGALPTLGQPTRFELGTGQSIAQFGAEPAIVVNRYGQGASALHAYDLAAMIAAQGANARNRALVQATLDSVANATSPLTTGDVARLVTAVTNRGANAVEIEAHASLPVGVSFVDAQPAAEFVAATATSPAQVVWRMTLPPDSTAELTLRVGVTSLGPEVLVVPVAVSARAAGSSATLQPQGSVEHRLVVEAGAALADAAQLAISALAPTRANDRAARDHALAAAQAARNLLALGNAAAAIAEWLKAADLLAGITSEDVGALASAQLAVARALEAATDRLCR